MIPAESVNSAVHEINPAENRPSSTWKGLNEIQFASLWSVIANEPFSDDRAKSIKVLTGRDGEAWILIFPLEFHKIVRNLSDREIITISKSWSEDEDFPWGWSEQIAIDFIRDFVRLSSEASKSGNALIYW
ncbi:MAG: hypothetical protein P8Y97_12700, partial [Candidatus Lokiarchaeota archaeon]